SLSSSTTSIKHRSKWIREVVRSYQYQLAGDPLGQGARHRLAQRVEATAVRLQGQRHHRLALAQDVSGRAVGGQADLGAGGHTRAVLVGTREADQEREVMALSLAAACASICAGASSSPAPGPPP